MKTDEKTVEQSIDKVDACLDEAQCSAERYDEALYKLALEAKESFDFVLAERRLLLRSIEQINAAFRRMLLNEESGGDGWWKGWEMLKKAHGHAEETGKRKRPDGTCWLCDPSKR